jgi:hypothetical protein
MRACLAFAALAVSIASCGGSPPTRAPTTPVAAPPQASAVAPAEPAPDVSAVPAPRGLAFTAHLAHPRRTIEQLTSALGSLAALFAGGAKLDPESLVSMAAGAPVGPLVDVDQPMDFAVSDIEGEGATKIAGAAVLLDPAAARATLERYYRWTPTGPGVVRLEPRDDAPDDASPRPCMLTVAHPAPATRLVCGVSVSAVRHLGPYLARTMPRVASSDDLRLELFVRELRAANKKDKAADDAATSDATDKIFEQAADQLAQDVGSLVLEASSDGTTLDLKLTSSFAGAGSPFTRALLGQGAAAAGAPPLFDRLPHDASFAWYGRGASAADLAPLRATLLDGFRQWAADDGYSDRQIETQLAPFQQLLLVGGPWAVAAGHRTDAARAALDAYSAGAKNAAARAKARAALQGWVVAGVEEPAQRWIDGVRSVVQNDAVKPAGKAKRKRDPQKESTKLALTPVPAGVQLPAGTLHVEARVTQNAAWLAKQKKANSGATDVVVPHTMHLFVVPDGGRTWFAVSEDPALAAAEVRASLTGAIDSVTLKTRTDLDPLRAQPASLAGFLSVAGLAMWTATDSSDEGLRKARDMLHGLATLSQGGTTPVPFTLTAAPKPGGTPADGGDFRMRVLFPLKVALEVAASPHSIF